MSKEAKTPRRLILHMGVQKTGSTGLQRHLHRNAAALADRLIVRTPEEGTPMRPLGRSAIAYSLNPGSDHKRALEIAFDDVLETLPPNDLPVVISHENLAGAMPGNGDAAGLFPNLPAIARILAAQAKDCATEFVIYTRNMRTWKPSVWAQAVRTDGYNKTIDMFTQETQNLPGWGDLMRRLADAVGAERVHRLRLEDETDDQHPGRQLLQLAGLTDPEIDALEPISGAANPRLNTNSIEFLRRLNGLALNPYARGKVVDLVARTQHLFAAEKPSEGTL